MVSILSLNYIPLILFSRFWGTVPRTPTTIRNIITFIFHNFFNCLPRKSRYLSRFFAFLCFHCVVNTTPTFKSFSPSLTDGFHWFEWQQVSLGLQDSSKYSSLYYNSSSDFQFSESPFQTVGDRPKGLTNDWYHNNHKIPKLIQFSGKIQVFVFLFAFFYVNNSLLKRQHPIDDKFFLINIRFAIARKTGVQSQVESYQRLKKCYLIPPRLTPCIIRWGSRVKWINPGDGVAPSPTLRCVSYWKGILRVTLN